MMLGVLRWAMATGSSYAHQTRARCHRGCVECIGREFASHVQRRLGHVSVGVTLVFIFREWPRRRHVEMECPLGRASITDFSQRSAERRHTR